MASVVVGTAAASSSTSLSTKRRGLRPSRRTLRGAAAAAVAFTAAAASSSTAALGAFSFASAPALTYGAARKGALQGAVDRRRPARAAAKKAVGKKTKVAGDEAGAGSSRTPISGLKVGQELEGTVVQWFFPGGITVDVGATAEGFLEVEEFRDGFPTGTIADTFKPGETIKVRALDLEDYTIAESAKFHLTMRSGDLTRPKRYVGEGIADVTPFLKAQPEDWFDGEVTLMSTWAVFVKVSSPETGKPFVGIVYKEEFRPGSDFENQVIRGGPCRVRVKEVDTECRRLLLTMRDVGDEPPKPEPPAPEEQK